MAQKTVRTNKAYKVDNWVEAVVLAYKGIRAVVRFCRRWRTELLVLGLMGTVYWGLRHEFDREWASIGLLVLVAAAAIWPRSRRLFGGRLRCSISRRQVISVMKETAAANGSGKLPRIRRSRVTPTGVQLSLVLRSGHSAEALEARTEEFRAGAHCRDARVLRNPNRSHLVSLELVHRDVLDGMVIDSPLTRYLRDYGSTARRHTDPVTEAGGE